MRYEAHSLEVKLLVATGAKLDVGELTDKWIEVSGTFTATINLQGSADGVAWVNLIAGLSVGWVEVPQTVRYVRCDTTAYTSGTPAVHLAGRMARAD
jgi:hypothetical protein